MISPASMRKVVVLPAPLGPSSPVMWPPGALKLTSRTAWTMRSAPRLLPIPSSPPSPLLPGAAATNDRATPLTSIIGPAPKP